MRSRTGVATATAGVLLVFWNFLTLVAAEEGVSWSDFQLPGAVTFSIHQVTVPPGSGVACVQLGLVVRYLAETPREWNSFGIALEYEDSSEMLVGEPFLVFANLGGDSSRLEGLTDPGTKLMNSQMKRTPCESSDILNVVNLSDGKPIPFVSGTGTRASISEAVNPILGRITGYASAETPLFETPANLGVLIAAIEFPIDRSVPGELAIRMPPAVLDGNFLGISFDESLDPGSPSTRRRGIRLNAKVNPGLIRVLKPLEEPLDLTKWGWFLFACGLGVTFLLLVFRVLLRGRSV